MKALGRKSTASPLWALSRGHNSRRTAASLHNSLNKDTLSNQSERRFRKLNIWFKPQQTYLQISVRCQSQGIPRCREQSLGSCMLNAILCIICAGRDVPLNICMCWSPFVSWKTWHSCFNTYAACHWTVWKSKKINFISLNFQATTPRPLLNFDVSLPRTCSLRLQDKSRCSVRSEWRPAAVTVARMAQPVMITWMSVMIQAHSSWIGSLCSPILEDVLLLVQ